MRNNQPITEEEYIIPEGATLISKTDLLGNITECNEAFELASGYTRQELIGQPHNLIRHPDIPQAVFKDLWDTLALGAPWSQIVKNRRANGGFYWVVARATPIFENGKLSGYMSVRSPALEAHKKAATQIYKDINSGKARIKNARVIYGFDWNTLKLFPRLNPQLQLISIIGLFYILPAMAYAFYTNVNPLIIAAIGLLGLIPPYAYGSMRAKAVKKSCEMLHTIASQQELVKDWYDPTAFNGKLESAITATGLASLEVREVAAFEHDQANRLQSAIDKVQSNIMISDMDHNIIYINETMETFFTKREAQLKTVMPDFSLKTLVGSNINQFHSHPNHMENTLERVAETEKLEMNIAGFHIILHIVPVLNRTGTQTATLVEWEDRTAQVQLMEQVNNTVQAAQKGELDKRIDLSLVEGVAKELSLSLNNLLDSISAPINEVVKVAIGLSKGDFTHTVDGELEGRFAVMQDSLNVALDNIGCMISEAKLAATNISLDASEIQKGSLELNSRTQSEAASLEETAASMEEMTEAVKKNADNAEQTVERTHHTVTQAKSGVEVMDNAIKSMEQISASSEKINDIIGLIDSIAFQTNLLALNAAVEAARAGEHGRGFAVVASEVRNLAGKSSDAAKDIRVLIEDTVNKVSEGTQHVKGSGEALHNIVDAIGEVSGVIEEIANSSREQSQGIDQINIAMTQIDSTVQQNSALAEKTTVTAEELNAIATTMNASMEQFTINKTHGTATRMRGPDDFDFPKSRRDLRQWQITVRSYLNDIETEFNREEAGSREHCPLGQWLMGEGTSFKDIPSVKQLDAEHAKFHEYVHKTLSLKDDGDLEGANKLMNSLSDEAEQVIALIGQVEADLQSRKLTEAPKKSAITSTEKTQTTPQKLETKRPALTKTQTPNKVDKSDEWADF